MKIFINAKGYKVLINENQHNYINAVKLLTSAGKFRISLGLERITKILELLGNPQDTLDCIHVAGTNGKGSVCSMLASILKESGKKVGLYTSPHIFKYTERIQISGNSISEEDFARYVFDIFELSQDSNIDLTEFEILTAVMFKYFSDNNTDVVVLETGLGGRFDATNVIKKNLCSVITHVDYDHTERLGNTLDKIAFEKAGIIKPNCPCIVLEGKEAYYDKAMELNAQLEIVNPLSLENNEYLSLKGLHQQENLALVLAVIEKCFPEISQDIIRFGLKNVKHPCRFQYIKEKNLIIDGAHNPNGIDALVKSLNYYYPNIKRRIIFGCLSNKDYGKMLSTLILPDDEVYFYHFNHQNSATYAQLQAVCSIKAKELNSDTEIDWHDGKINVICGSFYMISELCELLCIRI